MRYYQFRFALRRIRRRGNLTPEQEVAVEHCLENEDCCAECYCAVEEFFETDPGIARGRFLEFLQLLFDNADKILEIIMKIIPLFLQKKET